jgi:hypothetical protein
MARDRPEELATRFFGMKSSRQQDMATIQECLRLPDHCHFRLFVPRLVCSCQQVL